jgi:two-component system cell cycle response regulator DivK
LATESTDNWRDETGNPRRVRGALYTGQNRGTPALNYEATYMGGKITPGAMPGRPKTVLIVEDNELNMKLFNDLLEAHGYKVLQTRDGLSALDIARQNMPDLILMDIQLPEVSGIEVTKWLKEDDELRHIPVIAVTAFAMKGDEEKIREGGCEAYISKPISVISFLETIDSFLKRPQ